MAGVTGAIIGSKSIRTRSEQAVALDFNISASEDIDPSKIGQVVLNFEKFELTPQYIDQSNNPATVTVQISMDGGTNTSREEKVKLVNGETKSLASLAKFNNIETSVNTDKKILQGSVNIEVDIGDFLESYSQSFEIRSPDLPQSEGAEVSNLQLNNKTYQLYAFKSDGAFTVNTERDVDLLIVGGGGGGGGRHGSGGGAGGLVFIPDHKLSADKYDVKVGSGGTGGAGDESAGGKGGNSSFNSITAIGGGGGHARNFLAEDSGQGGSGCGGVEKNVPVEGAAGVQPNQNGLAGDYGFGNDGGDGAADGRPYAHGGGGGAGEVGGDGEATGDQSPGEGGDGLSGVTSNIGPYSNNYNFAEVFGTSYGEEKNGEVYFAGGGGGGSHDPRPSTFKNFGGLGGGGAGGQEDYSNDTDSGEFGDDGENGQANTGGGGGGGSTNSGPGGGGGNGGSGIVLIRVGPI